MATTFEQDLASPPQKFLDAKAELDRPENQNVTMLSHVADWDPDEQDRFIMFYASTSFEARQSKVKAQAATPSQSSADYIKSLTSLDFTSEDSIDAFLDTAQPYNFQPDPQPVFLGAASPCLYYLQSKQVFLETKSDVSFGRAIHTSISELRPSQKTTSPLIKYGLCLGTLQWRLDPTVVETLDPGADPNPNATTPFRVWTDVVERTIWILLDPNQKDDLGNDVEVDVSLLWQMMPSPNPAPAGKQFDAFRLMTFDELKNVDPKHQLFNADVLKSGQFAGLLPYRAATDDVVAAIKKAPKPSEVGVVG